MNTISIKQTVLIIVAVSLTACTATEKVNVENALPALPEDCQPAVYRAGDVLPATFRVVGDVAYGDSGFSVACGRETVTERLRQQACKAGANGIRIKKEKGLDLWSSCYRVEAELFSVPGT